MPVKAAVKKIVTGGLDPLERALVEARRHKATTSAAKCGFVLDDGTLTTNQSVCHAIMYVPNIKGKVSHVLNYLQKTYTEGMITDEIRRAYAEWLVNFSPYRHVLVSKNIDEIMKDEFFIVDATKPQNVVAAACQSSRGLSEHPTCGRVWFELVKAGVHPNLAFILSFMFSTDTKMIYPYLSTHTGIFETVSMSNRATIAKYISGEFVQVDAQSYRDKPEYQGSTRLSLVKGGETNFNKKLFDRAIALSKGGPVKQVNPFGSKATAGTPKLPLKEGCAFLAQVLKEEFKKELENARG